ncbi:MAG: STAS/SEC14 domain-containing protein [Rhizobiaceae bacterium]
MLSYEILEDDGIVVVSAVGQVTFEDYQETLPKLIAEITSNDIRKLLLDHRRHEVPASKKAGSVSFDALQQARGLYDKIAFVSHDSTETLELLEYFQHAEKDIRQFPVTQYDGALDWLRGDQSADH